jgi:hypothetical protein
MAMKTKTFLLIICAIFTASLHAQDCSFYYPESVGAKLVYKNYDKKDKPLSTVSQEVTSYTRTATGAEATVLVKSYDDKDKPTGENTLQVKCEAGVFYFDMKGYISPETMNAYKDMEIKVSSENLEIPSHIKVGDKLKDGSVTMDISSGGFKFASFSVFITDRTVDAQESVTTQAGTFTCFKFSETITSKVMVKTTSKSYEWLCPEVGVIKNEGYTTDGKLNSRMELIEYKK